MAFQYAGRYGPEAVTDRDGNAQLGTPIPVLDSAGAALATLYINATRTTQAANPVLSDAATGNLTFYADPGDYQLSTSSGLIPITVPMDPRDLPAHVAATDPHGDRAHSDSADTAHTAATDPHGDRADATSKIATHSAAADPHGDRSYTDTRLAALVNAAPAALDTLNELALALGDDANFAATMTTALAGKLNVVVHGSTAGTARPAAAIQVLWIGTVAPTNAATNDLWWDKTATLLKLWSGSVWQVSGNGVYAPANSLGRVPASKAPLLRPPNRRLQQKYAAVRPAITANNSPGQNSYQTFGEIALTTSATRAAVAIGDTQLYTYGFVAAGTILTVDTAGQQETLTAAADGTDAGSGDYLVTLTSAATKTHAQGVVVTAHKDYQAKLTGTQIATGTVFTIYGGVAYTTSGTNSITTVDPHSTLWQPTMTVEFATDSPLFAMEMSATATSVIEIIVNGEIVYDGIFVPGGAWCQIDWAGVRARRVYRIRGLYTFGRLRVGAADSVWALQNDTRPVCATIGDSYAQGSPNGVDSLGAAICEMMGWKAAVSSEGGTGYGNPATAGATANFKDRAADLIAVNPDIVLSLGGKNDAAGTVAADSLAFWQTIHAALPKALLFATSVLNQGSLWDVQSQSVSNGPLKASIEAVGGIYLDMRGSITGSGKVDSPKQDGNADQCAAADGTHLTAQGYAVTAAHAVELLTGQV